MMTSVFDRKENIVAKKKCIFSFSHNIFKWIIFYLLKDTDKSSHVSHICRLRDRDRQRDRHTETEIHRQTERQTDRDSDRDRQTGALLKKNIAC